MNNNAVTNFMLYLFNKWCIGEAKKVFGNSLGEHIFSKWVHHREGTKLGDLYWYSELDNYCRQKIVDRANELYNK
jgi:hypothetical protein